MNEHNWLVTQCSETEGRINQQGKSDGITDNSGRSDSGCGKSHHVCQTPASNKLQSVLLELPPPPIGLTFVNSSDPSHGH